MALQAFIQVCRRDVLFDHLSDYFLPFVVVRKLGFILELDDLFFVFDFSLCVVPLVHSPLDLSVYVFFIKQKVTLTNPGKGLNFITY